MNGAGASDLVLALVCGWLVAARMARQPGLGLAALLIGLAAVLGVLRFGGFDLVTGPHRFASMLSAVAAFPLLAWVLRWPDDPIAVRFAGAARAVLLLGGIGVTATLTGVSGWGPAVSVVSAVMIMVTMVEQRNPVGIIGAVVLIVALAAAAAGKAALFDSTVVLHLGLAAALALLALGSERRLKFKQGSIASPPPRG